ncbi:response regulator [Aggregicoccus sp. 17bor-14]|uniref:response regulator n=1 Tax=Myxococcaceae TaxID=31 RepID=UPI00129CDE2E|nr:MULTISPECIES: response regulator [Myxococcaceae]MBF5046250.1 response regulator [Simulacricoccus sp. 17bor-14]MRI91973.1 response regulator [Aggregicoccus sp. 17bor-14]
MEPYAPLRQSLVQLLEEDGYQVQAAASAEALLAQLRTGHPAELPALVLLGTKYPLREGREVLARLAERGLLQHVPVVLLSPRRQWPEGAADLLEMPFSLEQLRSVVARHAGWARAEPVPAV